MSNPLSLYRRAIERLVLSLIVSALGAIVVPFALYKTFYDVGRCSMVLIALVPWALSLANMWRHVFEDFHALTMWLLAREELA